MSGQIYIRTHPNMMGGKSNADLGFECLAASEGASGARSATGARPLPCQGLPCSSPPAGEGGKCRLGCASQKTIHEMRSSGGTFDAQLLHTGFERGGLEAE